MEGSILFLCDRKDKESWCQKSCYADCKHTSRVDHAINKKIFEEDPVGFLFNRCDSYTWFSKKPVGNGEIKCVLSDKVNFWERDDRMIADGKKGD